MERETKIIITPVGKKNIEIHTYITGREKRALTNVYLDGKLGFDIENQKVDNISHDMIDKAQDLAFKTCVVSIDGKKDGEIQLVEAILDLQSPDYDFVVAEINKVTTGTLDEEKKTA
jgi:hypothetical protein